MMISCSLFHLFPLGRSSLRCKNAKQKAGCPESPIYARIQNINIISEFDKTMLFDSLVLLPLTCLQAGTTATTRVSCLIIYKHMTYPFVFSLCFSLLPKHQQFLFFANPLQTPYFPPESMSVSLFVCSCSEIGDRESSTRRENGGLGLTIPC
ncbi:unnamed protein product [Periconia digitata]|uniref:Uncharacterized protein n=1 Tax=Periconia digitata TaxID=1303443 RepID=A0A9W4U710_9PLEO|nr:unnamed protein product [Periconia digitata]